VLTLETIVKRYQEYVDAKEVFIIVCRKQKKYLIIRRRLIEKVMKEMLEKVINRSNVKEVLKALEIKGYIRLLRNKQLLFKYLKENMCKPYKIIDSSIGKNNNYIIRDHILNFLSGRDHVIILALDDGSGVGMIAKECRDLLNIVSYS